MRWLCLACLLGCAGNQDDSDVPDVVEDQAPVVLSGIVHRVDGQPNVSGWARPYAAGDAPPVLEEHIGPLTGCGPVSDLWAPMPEAPLADWQDAGALYLEDPSGTRVPFAWWAEWDVWLPHRAIEQRPVADTLHLVEVRVGDTTYGPIDDFIRIPATAEPGGVTWERYGEPGYGFDEVRVSTLHDLRVTFDAPPDGADLIVLTVSLAEQDGSSQSAACVAPVADGELTFDALAAFGADVDPMVDYPDGFRLVTLSLVALNRTPISVDHDAMIPGVRTLRSGYVRGGA